MYEFQTIANVETYHQDTSSPSLNPLDYCLPSGALSRNSIAFDWAPDDKINSPMSFLMRGLAAHEQAHTVFMLKPPRTRV
jgi:hypothetical protein